VRSERPKQIENLLETIRKLLEYDRVIITEHAAIRQKERRISAADVLYVLKYGFHERQKTVFDPAHQAWKYAIRGKTADRVDLRVIVGIEDKVVVITVIRIGGDEL